MAFADRNTFTCTANRSSRVSRCHVRCSISIGSAYRALVVFIFIFYLYFIYFTQSSPSKTNIQFI